MDGDRWARPGPTARQRRHDGWIAAAVSAFALVNVALTNSAGAFVLGPPPSVPEQVAWTLATTVPLAWRRRGPEAVLLVVAVVFIAGQARSNPETQATSGALFTAVYTAGAWGRDRQRARRLRAAVIAVMFGWLAVAIVLRWDEVAGEAYEGARGPLPPLLALVLTGVLTNVLYFGAAYAFGEVAWTAAHREYQLRERTEQLRRSQEAAREQAVVQERLRIARELHDVVAHHVSVMGIQAAAARRVLDRDAARARGLLAAVEQSARNAVDELRRMLGVLRTADQPAPADTPATGLEQVEGLLAGARTAGLSVAYGVFGDPVPLPRSLSQAAYRVVQEALTNTLKHAGAGGVDVRVRYLSRELEVDVADDGRGGAPQPGRGLGLVGMRERVAAHDGTLETGPRPGGGFRVRARFPLPVGTPAP